VEAAMNNYFDSLDSGGLSTLKTHLHNSQAKWDETAFGGAMYGGDDATIPSTSTPVLGTSKGNNADKSWF
jgi:hypothetical protein